MPLVWLWRASRQGSEPGTRVRPPEWPRSPPECPRMWGRRGGAGFVRGGGREEGTKEEVGEGGPVWRHAESPPTGPGRAECRASGQGAGVSGRRGRAGGPSGRSLEEEPAA